MTEALKPLDHNALRFNQGVIILCLILAFLTDLIWLIPLVALIMMIGTVFSRPGFFPLYRLLRRLGLIEPDPRLDQSEPHRFAQGFGSVVLLLATSSWALDLELLMWILVWLVIALAGLNLFAGFCLGCAMYYWLQHLGVPGFRRRPPPGITPGRRPPAMGE